MKRSRSLTLTSLMAGGSLTLSACGGDAAAPAVQWGEDPPAATASADQVEAANFATVENCISSGDFTEAECREAYAAAQADNEANAPRFGDRQTCEEQHGVDQCVPRNNGSFFTPLLTGFIIGQALDGFGSRRYYGRPYYTDRRGAYLPGGQRLGQSYVGGGYRVNRDALAPPRATAPTRTQSRSAVVSRGGFGGGGGRSYGG
jgi:uncharacterized protein YgiB involved in biofilm formation